MNDIEQRIAAMSSQEKSDLLLELVTALHDEDTDRTYKTLREWGLEEDLEKKDERLTDACIIQSAIDGLREFYPVLNNPLVVEDVRIQVVVRDTGNHQADYQRVRDQVERLVQDRTPEE